MKMPASVVFQTPGSTQHVMGALMKPGLLGLLANQNTGLDVSKANWAECASILKDSNGVPSHNSRSAHGQGGKGECGGCDCGGECTDEPKVRANQDFHPQFAQSAYSSGYSLESTANLLNYPAALDASITTFVVISDSGDWPPKCRDKKITGEVGPIYCYDFDPEYPHADEALYDWLFFHIREEVNKLCETLCSQSDLKCRGEQQCDNVFVLDLQFTAVEQDGGYCKFRFEATCSCKCMTPKAPELPPIPF